jgi:hypothetical protein
VRLSEFDTLMAKRFGAYADSLSRDLVLAGLGGRTVREALEAGVDPTVVWRVVCEAAEVPAHER